VLFGSLEDSHILRLHVVQRPKLDQLIQRLRYNYSLELLSGERVLSLCPVVSSTRLSEDEVVGTEEITKSTRFDSIHGARFEID